jgi:hypothetical protein
VLTPFIVDNNHFAAPGQALQRPDKESGCSRSRFHDNMALTTAVSALQKKYIVHLTDEERATLKEVVK